ncbi:BglG family transcription antiterminator [Listeria ivanovii]|uniref:Transcription antiterminator n=2 Tax=Listeria ivanovii TaxID=1638 RepID=A0ABS1G5I5_LISIV|nr:PRD domain-containing protein [Listeria ivanovii]AIS60540.1 XRE family transcriptional regulator [Listeria ivanovii subsp. londoniensis]AIS63369.1 XRE family transcriptional regulator [Listeria ivanovii subsp. londoniensis]MBC2255830.1 transcription antiterminator [Listeria ivanovii]MBK1962118.1 transcription antiterminator [Listeria ivanovii subsp. londoniensis]MBK1966440.1 transcription antiterminator [Listeria ivanovii subsp. londoniensis]
MLLTKTERALINLFLTKNDFLTASQLAGILDVSSKTIYRKIKNINSTTGKKDILISEKGRGFKLDYKAYIQAKLETTEDIFGYTPTERREKILLQILFKSPKYLNIHDLYEGYYVGYNSIKNDFTLLNQSIEKYHLTIQKRQKEIRVVGTEENIRVAINEVINNLDLFRYDDLKTEYSDLNKEDVQFIVQQMEIIENKLEISIPYPYDINIFSHLYILINRFRQGEVEDFAETSEKYTITNETLYLIAVEAIEAIEQYLDRKLPNCETFHFLQYLISSRFNHEIELVPNNCLPIVEEMTDFYINQVAAKMNIPFNKKQLKIELLSHMKPMVNRMNHQINIKNNLLSDIKLEYGSLFEIIKKTARDVAKTFKIHTISEDEIGYITIYFAKHIEQSPLIKRIIIMCSSGIGTSELLKVKVQKAFPDVEIVDVLSSTRFKNNLQDYRNIDFILTTIQSDSNDSIPSLLVSAMFTEKDKMMVKKLMESL